jgi:formylglycine-generating enzyme required for sulfatase activity
VQGGRFADDTGYATEAEGHGSSFVCRLLLHPRARDAVFVQVDVFAHCGWAGARLPTEAAWEYAARGGNEGRRHSWVDDSGGMVPVDAYEPNGLGLFNTAGNVWEWWADRFAPRGEERVIRGGSYLCHAPLPVTVTGSPPARRTPPTRPWGTAVPVCVGPDGVVTAGG